ncbi:MAG TPA: hypothetical protein VFR31_20820 [Thermoanaerobaculia bacterium]|nr:hypothetical protein [Thermoanaerobaculia bacterium]
MAEELLATAVIEHNSDGYVAYTKGIAGVVVGEGSTPEEALVDIESAVLFHIKTFGEEILQSAESTAPNLKPQRAPGRGR